MSAAVEAVWTCLAPARDWCSRRGRVLVRILVRWKGKGPRNVMVEDVQSGERWTRPFRGMRKLVEVVQRLED